MSSSSVRNVQDVRGSQEPRGKAPQGLRLWGARIAALAFVLGLLVWWLPSAVVGPTRFVHDVFHLSRPAWWAPAGVRASQAACFLGMAVLAERDSRPRKVWVFLALWVLAMAAWQAWRAFPG